MGEKRPARLTLGGTHSLSPTDGLETHPAQYGHVDPTTRPRAFRCIIARTRPTLTSHSDPAIFRTAPCIPLPSIGRRIQHHHDVPCYGFRRHTRLWRRRACPVTGRGDTPHPVHHDWCACEARPHLGRKHCVAPSATIEAIASGPCSCGCRFHSFWYRSFARAIVPLLGRRRRSPNEGGRFPG
jgi:hypothetical protein